MDSHMTDLRSLIATACDACSATSVREGAERKILEIQRNPDTWKIYVELMQSAEDSILFFIAQGLKYAAIKYWHHISPSEQKLFSDKVLYCLLTRGASLMPYSKSKVEQVISAMCISRGSVGAVLDFLDASNCTQTVGLYASTCAQQAASAGGDTAIAGCAGATDLHALLDSLLVCLSLLRTVIEDVCTSQPAGSGQPARNKGARTSRGGGGHGAVVDELLASHARTFVELACGSGAICYYSYFVQFRLDHSGAGVAAAGLQGEYSGKLSAVLLQSVQCLRALVAHLPIGPHLGAEPFELLVRLASLGLGGGSAVTGPDSTGCSSPGMLSWSSLPDDCASPAATVVSQVASSLVSVSSLAVDTLSELLWLRYLPTSAPGPAGGAVVDSSMPLLMLLLSAVTRLLTHYRTSCTRDVTVSFPPAERAPARASSCLSIVTTNLPHEWEEMPTVIALVGFLAAFVQCHLERCVRFVTTGLADGGRGPQAETAGSMCALLLTLLCELQRLTIQAKGAALVARLASVWRDLIELLHTCEGGAVLGLLAQGRAHSGVSVPVVWNTVVRHLLLCSLFQYNAQLAEELEEASVDLELHPYADSDVKAAVARFDYNGGTAGAAAARARDEDAEDGNPALAMLQATTTCITCALEFSNINHPDANTEDIPAGERLSAVLPELFQRSVAAAFAAPATPLQSPGSVDSASSTQAQHHGGSAGAGGGAAVMDCAFLLPFLPLMGLPADALVPQLMGCLLDVRLQSKGKLFTHFYIQCCHMVGRLLSARFVAEFAAGADAARAARTDLLPTVVTQLLQLVGGLCQAAFIAPASHPVTVASFSLLLGVLVQCDRVGAINNPAVPALGELLLPASCAHSVQQMVSSVSACLPADVVCLLSCVHFYVGPAHFLAHVGTRLEQVGGQVCQITDATNAAAADGASYSTLVRALAAVESATVLLQHQSAHPLYAKKKQQVLEGWAALPQILPAVLQAVLTNLLEQLRARATARASGVTELVLSEAQVALLGAARAVLTAADSLLCTFGKRAYGAVACALFSTSGGFLLAAVDTAQSTVLQALLCAANPTKALPFLQQCLQLSQTIGRTGSSSKAEGGVIPAGAATVTVPSSAEVLRLGFALLSGVSAQMHLATVRAELLHPVIEAGWSLVKCFWVRPPMAAPGAPAPAAGDVSGANVQPVVEFLTQLFATCLVTETVAPGDVLSCLTNMHSMSQDGRTLFSTPWFVQNCRQSVILSSVRALMLNFHSAYHDNVISLLQEIVNRTAETRAEYSQYLGSVVAGVAMEFGCQIEAEFVINLHTATQENAGSSAASNKFDVEKYCTEVIFVMQRTISSSESCLKI